MGRGKIVLIIFAVFTISFFYTCVKSQTDKVKIEQYFITGDKNNKENLKILFNLLAEIQETDIVKTELDRFRINREIAGNYIRQKEYAKLVNFLTLNINRYPEDPYNVYYMFMTAFAYMDQQAYPVAEFYYDMVLKNYRDMTINGESIHLSCLNQLINLKDDPEHQVKYYEELIKRFPEKIDLGTAYFKLAQGYEKTGEWNGAIRAYTQFLPFRDSIVPGFPNAGMYARQIVDFNKSSKDWSFYSLDALIKAVKTALDEGSSWDLEQYRAKVNFFTRTWGMETDDDFSMADFYLTDYMAGSQIRYDSLIDTSSTANEAYLRTWGWAQNVSTWYLYFRKINFPLDPEIHGQWEWAGIYYGEKF